MGRAAYADADVDRISLVEHELQVNRPDGAHILHTSYRLLEFYAAAYHPSFVAFNEACLNKAVCSASNSSRDAVFEAALRDAIRSFFFCKMPRRQ